MALDFRLFWSWNWLNASLSRWIKRNCEINLEVKRVLTDYNKSDGLRWHSFFEKEQADCQQLLKLCILNYVDLTKISKKLSSSCSFKAVSLLYIASVRVCCTKNWWIYTMYFYFIHGYDISLFLLVPVKTKWLEMIPSSL